MLYHSFEFAALFAVVLGAFAVSPQKYRPPLLLAASYLFYSDFEPAHLLVLLVVTGTTYAGAIEIGKGRGGAVLVGSVGVALGALAYFKYSALLWRATGAAEAPPWSPTLPIGISFYTFQAVSYLVDVRRGRIEPDRDLLRVALYLAFFPQVLAGPIERAGRLLPQLRSMARPPGAEVFVGAKVVLWGLFCKLVVADKLGLLVDPIYAVPGDHPGLAALVAIYLYAFQIFFDFYGYTTVSIGLARMLGVRLSINFDNPYAARSIRDFWRRWHITLTSWFRDYVYVPLGGRAPSRWVWFRNVMAVFLLSGLWHGAALNFLVWGGLHGLYYVVGALTATWRARVWTAFGGARVPGLRGAVGLVWTFHLVTAAWIVFRVGAASDSWTLVRGALGVSGPGWLGLGDVLGHPSAAVYLACFGCALLAQASGFAWRTVSAPSEGWRAVGVEMAFLNTLVVGLVLLGDIGSRAFIYFRF